MTPYSLTKNTLILRVKKSPTVMRLLLYIFTILCGLLPVFGLVFSIVSYGELKFFNILIWVGFWLLCFYMLKVSLWNTFGEEQLRWENGKVTYLVNYGWFKEKEKVFDFKKPIYSIEKVGYEEDQKGIFIISENELVLRTAAKLSLEQLDQMILELYQNKDTAVSGVF